MEVSSFSKMSPATPKACSRGIPFFMRGLYKVLRIIRSERVNSVRRLLSEKIDGEIKSLSLGRPKLWVIYSNKQWFMRISKRS